MASRIWTFRGFRFSTRHFAWVALLCFLTRFALPSVLADGCFVFRWDKKVDINEPTQKAIIVYGDGREDLLLQVKYEGPLNEFGWLIPVPALPKVAMGSMDAFYELSELTQRQQGGFLGVVTAPMGGEEARVKVIELKTVGAYEVAVLSAQDAGSLARWLKSHDYAVPESAAGTVEEYIRKGWYFVAARIQLDKPVALQVVSTTSPKDVEGPIRARQVIQRQLASGGLHPILISFDTPNCIFPLKISAAGGKPSEVSLYVLSAEPLLDPFIFGKACASQDRRRAEWEQAQPTRAKGRQQSMEHLRIMHLSLHIGPAPSRAGNNTPVGRRDWSLEELAAMAKEDQTPGSDLVIEDDFIPPLRDWLQCMRVTPDQISRSAARLPRLKNKSWYLTKQVWTFEPREMHDLEFQPAIPALAKLLARPWGMVAAALLAQLGDGAVPVLLAASQSTNSIEQVNAAAAFASREDPRWVKPLLRLFTNEIPLARLHAVQATGPNWDTQFTEPLRALFYDPYPQIRREAAQCLALHETPDRCAVYLELLKDANPDVQECALRVLSHVNGYAIPRALLLKLLGSPRLETVSQALSLLQHPQERQGLVPSWSPFPFAGDATGKNWLTSLEATPLTTNSLTVARLMGLRILQHNADADAVDLVLPLLKDRYALVRSRALSLLQSVTDQDLPENDPKAWDQWWATNRATFGVRHPAGPTPPSQSSE